MELVLGTGSIWFHFTLSRVKDFQGSIISIIYGDHLEHSQGPLVVLGPLVETTALEAFYGLIYPKQRAENSLLSSSRVAQPSINHM